MTQAIAVVGAGPGGLSAALKLAQAGQAVHLFEAADGVGGLARGFSVGGEAVERYYHHVFTHDQHVVAQAEALGLGSQLEWLKGSTAVWAGDRLRPFNGALDLLRYDAISLPQRLRVGLATLAIRHLPRPEGLDHQGALAWLRRWYGEAGTEAIWAPLLHKKFEAEAERVSAAWMFEKIALRGSSRQAGRGEALGYMKGSFQVLHEAMAQAFVKAGGALHLKAPLLALRRDDAGWWLQGPAGEAGPFAQVLLAIPPKRIAKLLPGVAPEAEAQLFAGLKAQGAVVALLALDRPLSPYYWTNVNDPALPMGAIIEHTNLVPAERYGAHLVYLPRYTASDSAYYALSDEAVLEQHLASLQRLYPGFHPAQVKESWVFRDAYTQPVTPVGYAQARPPLASASQGLFFATMHHIFPEDRGMNYAMAVGQQVAQRMLSPAAAAQG